MIYLSLLILTTVCISIPTMKVFLKKKETQDLLFLVLTNGIFILSTSLFLFYFHDKLLSIISSFFLLGYSVFLILLLKKETGQFEFLELPYFLFTLSLFCSLFFL